MQALQITNQRNTYANYKFDNKKVQIMKVGIENWRKRNYKTEAIQILGSSSNSKLKSPKQKVVEQARLEKPPLNVQCGKVQASQRLKSFKKKLGF